MHDRASINNGVEYRRRRTRAPQQPDDAGTATVEDDSTARVDGSCDSGKEVDDASVGDSTPAKPAVRDTKASNLDHGSMVCLVGPDGELMGLKSTTTGKSEAMALLPISTTIVEAGSSKRIQSYPSHSIFIVTKQVMVPFQSVSWLAVSAIT